jgi:hypothetical protein
MVHPDRQLQNLIAKIFPHFAEEEKRMREEYEKHPSARPVVRPSELVPPASVRLEAKRIMPSEEKKARRLCTYFHTHTHTLSLSLSLYLSLSLMLRLLR